ncbi:MAG TPA: DUF3786 domain-containing protein [Candidatus Krumholzibacteriaceae bacterium]|nr:DUF3786 domain-containing protein [Candidatus Krumholzibacteriaceae bacterium]
MSKPRDQVREIWNWQRCQNQIRSLQGRLGFPDSDSIRFLGLHVSLQDGSINDELTNEPYKDSEVTVYFILHGYANAKPAPETTQLISFKQLSGGEAYFKAFTQRAIHPLLATYSQQPHMLVEAAKLLGGTPQTFGDYSVKIHSLPLVPLTIILWTKSAEFSTSANVLFDSNANNYLTTEELAGLSGLTIVRLKNALEILNKDA